MRKSMVFFTIFVFCFFSTILLSMELERSIEWELERQEKLENFSERMSEQWKQNRTIAEERAQKEGIPVRKDFEDGRVIELQKFLGDIPLYYTTNNLEAASTISSDKVWPDGGANLNLTGSTEILGMWDAGLVRTGHQEFNGRVIQKDDAEVLDDHATHVAGTMVAAGVESTARGMSYEATLHAYDWNDDLSEMSGEVADGMQVSNHSYGFITGWFRNYFGDNRWAWFGNTSVSETEDYLYGFYSESAKLWDELVYDSETYLPVIAAGNDRNKGPEDQPVSHWVRQGNSWVLSDTERQLSGGEDGYDSISHFSLAKNVLTVGAVEGISGGYSQPEDIVMSSFSGWGPTDDGRVKPDIVAKGVSTYSTWHDGDDAYNSISGTSMAAPSVSGSIGLLQQHYRDLLGDTPPLASTMKCLIIHTADAAGDSKGPDYEHGWGLMNTQKAAQLISDHADEVAQNSVNRGYIFEVNLFSGNKYSLNIQSDGNNPVKATMAWSDPPGTPLTSNLLNNRSPMLVNDLDLRIYGPDNTEYKPWILDPDNPSEPATTGDNYRDNVEQVYIENPQEGIYTIEVTHKGGLQGISQKFSLIISEAVTDEEKVRRFAVTPASWDDMGTILDDLGRDWDEISHSDLADYDKIKEYTAIFIGCTSVSTSWTQNAYDTMRQYIFEGGALYTSDYAVDYITHIFPDKLDLVGKVGVGGQTINANVTDSALATFLNPESPPSKVDVYFNLGDWVVINDVPDDVRVHLRGNVNASSNTYYEPDTSNCCEACAHASVAKAYDSSNYDGGELKNKPLLVSFNHGSGRVIFTSFHNEAQPTAMQEKLLNYFVLLLETTRDEEELNNYVEKNFPGYIIDKKFNNFIDQGKISTPIFYSASGGRDLLFAANWDGNSQLKLSVYKPDGDLYAEVSTNNPPMVLKVDNAAKGNWSYTVTGENVAYDNFPYLVMIGQTEGDDIDDLKAIDMSGKVRSRILSATSGRATRLSPATRMFSSRLGSIGSGIDQNQSSAALQADDTQKQEVVSSEELYDASVADIERPFFLSQNGEYTLELTMKNTGNIKWEKESDVYLVAVNDYNDLTPEKFWRIGLEEDVVPGGKYTFAINLYPKEIGTYTLAWQMVKLNAFYFGEIFREDIKVVETKLAFRLPGHDME